MSNNEKLKENARKKDLWFFTVVCIIMQLLHAKIWFKYNFDLKISIMAFLQAKA